MLNEIKLALRRTSTTFDNEIKDNIETALLELSRVGVNVEGITSESENVNKLIIKACELYCKSQFNFMSKGELFQKNFEALRDALAVTSQYTDEVSE
jgi:hypothetical protein